MAFPKRKERALDVQQPVSGARADPQCSTRVNHCHHLGTCLASAVGTLSPKTQGEGPGGNPNPPASIRLGRAMSLDLDTKLNSNPNPDPNPNPNCNPDVASSLIPNLCCPFHFIRWILCLLPCWKWQNLEQPVAAAQDPLLDSHCHLHPELDRGEGSDLLWSPSSSREVLGAAMLGDLGECNSQITPH